VSSPKPFNTEATTIRATDNTNAAPADKGVVKVQQPSSILKRKFPLAVSTKPPTTEDKEVFEA
jgi:hypothetical protein